MSRRYSDAIAIQLGACNPSGIAHSILDACREIRDEPNHTGTAQITSDPAIRLMAHQLAFICGIIDTTADLAREPNYSACLDACNSAIKVKEAS